MSKLITSIVLAAILTAIVSFITGANSDIPAMVNTTNATILGAVLGLFIG